MRRRPRYLGFALVNAADFAAADDDTMPACDPGINPTCGLRDMVHTGQALDAKAKQLWTDYKVAIIAGIAALFVITVSGGRRR